MKQTDDINVIKSAVARNMRGMVLNCVLDFGNKYVISVEKKESDQEMLMDPYFSVDKKTGRLSEFNPLMDIERFKKEIKNPLYLRSRDE